MARALIIGDPFANLNPAGDTSLMIAAEGLARGHGVAYADAASVSARGAAVFAHAQDLAPSPALAYPDGQTPQTGAATASGQPQRSALADYDFVFVRKDPPFDWSYLRLLHCLQYAQGPTRVLADPSGLLRFTEKLVPASLIPFMPDTLVTQSLEEASAFLAEKRSIVLKPLYRGGGAGVMRVEAEGQNLPALMELMTTLYGEPVLVQEYLPAVTAGDKRVLMVDGTVTGVVNRVPDRVDFRSNLRVGGRAESVDLTAREQEACRAVAAETRAHGVVMVGLDFIGEYLTEVNVTSPTGARQLEMLSGVSAAAAYWDALEAQA